MSAGRPVLTPDHARDHRRQADANRLLTYDRNAAALVAMLNAVASRIEAGEADGTDAATLRREAHLLSRCLPPDVPIYPDD